MSSYHSVNYFYELIQTKIDRVTELDSSQIAIQIL